MDKPKQYTRQDALTALAEHRKSNQEQLQDFAGTALVQHQDGSMLTLANAYEFVPGGLKDREDRCCKCGLHEWQHQTIGWKSKPGHCVYLAPWPWLCIATEHLGDFLFHKEDLNRWRVL